MFHKNQAFARKVGISIAAVSALALFAGCSSGGSDADGGGEEAASESSVVEAIQEAGVVRVATLGNNAPWSNVAADGEQAGFDVDLANALAEKLGVEIEFLPVDGPGRVAALQSDQADITVGEFAATDERDEVVDFSQEYVLNQAQYMVREDSGINSKEDLNDSSKTVCVQQGGTANDLVPVDLPEVELLPLPSVNDCLEAVRSGQADSMSETAFTYRPLMDRDPGVFKVLDGSYGTNYISVGVQDGASDLVEYINEFLVEYQGDGRFDESFQKNFGFEMPENTRPDWFV